MTSHREYILKKISIYIFVIILIFSLWMTKGKCEEAIFISDVQFNNWVTYYYLSPKPHQTISALKYFCTSNMYNDKTILSIMSFFVASLKNNNIAVNEIYSKLDQNGTIREKTFFLDVLWLINTEKSKKLIEKARLEWNDKEIQEKIVQQNASIPYNILTAPIISPQVLDMLWATFFATGEKEPICRIISVIHLSNVSNAKDMLVGKAAVWSLISNCKQHSKVLEICEEEESIQRGITKDMLINITKQAKS